MDNGLIEEGNEPRDGMDWVGLTSRETTERERGQEI